jgi:hypothetical protein
MTVEYKERAVISFLLLEGRAGEEIVMRLQIVYSSAAYCCPLIFRWIGEVHRGMKEPPNKGRPGRPDRYETDAAIRSILQEDSNASLRAVAETL